MPEKQRKSFKNRQEVLKYLQNLGFSVKKSKIYKDSHAGLLMVGAGGRITMESVQRYIHMGGLKKRVEVDPIEAAVGADRKLQEEIKRLELQNLKLGHDLRGLRAKYIPKTEAEAEMTALIALLDALPRRTLLLGLPRYLTAAGGDPGKSGEFLQLFGEDLSREVNKILDDGGDR